jgi:hypothetical protein
MTIHHPTRPASCLAALLVLGAAPLAAGEAAVGVYECTKDGVTTFSDQPCGVGEKHIEVDYQRATPGAGAAAQDAEAQAGAVAEAQVLDTEIVNIQQRISRLQNEQQSRIAELRRQRYAGTEQLDQKAWQAGIDAQIQAAANEYQSAIDRESARLAELQAKRAALPLSQP